MNPFRSVPFADLSHDDDSIPPAKPMSMRSLRAARRYLKAQIRKEHVRLSLMNQNERLAVQLDQLRMSNINYVTSAAASADDILRKQ